MCEPVFFFFFWLSRTKADGYRHNLAQDIGDPDLTIYLYPGIIAWSCRRLPWLNRTRAIVGVCASVHVGDEVGGVDFDLRCGNDIVCDSYTAREVRIEGNEQLLTFK